MSRTTNCVPGSATLKPSEICSGLSVFSILQYTEAASGSNARKSRLFGMSAYKTGH